MDVNNFLFYQIKEGNIIVYLCIFVLTNYVYVKQKSNNKLCSNLVKKRKLCSNIKESILASLKRSPMYVAQIKNKCFPFENVS